MKKLNWYYCISILMPLLLISFTALVKTVIWFDASLEKVHQKNIVHEIIIYKGTSRNKVRYTSESKQKVFQDINYLLAPAFIMLFASLAVKLVKTEDIFD